MNKKSFTLIELLLVISIIGLLTLVIVSGLRSTTDRAKIARTLLYQASLHRSIGDHLVGWWNFNEEDARDNNNHGEAVGTLGWESGVPGTEGCALDLNGSNWVKIGPSSVFSFETGNKITLSVWIKNRNVTEGWQSIFDNRPSGDQRNWGLVKRQNNGRLIFSYRNSANTTFQYFETNSEHLINNQWLYLVVTYIYGNGNSAKIYIDGIEVPASWTSGDGNLEPWISNGPINIGSYGSGTNRWNGLIDDVRIYNTALTSEEVERIYAETKDKYLAEE